MSLSAITIHAALAVSILAASPLAEAASAAGATAAPEPVRRTAVGRAVYPVPRDLGEAGSVSDVLRTVPFVDVDAEGEVSLRGDPNVTILLDGQSSILLSGGSRALALQRMAASTVAWIEVIRGASAQFPSNGAGGVINIVTRDAPSPAGAERGTD